MRVNLKELIKNPQPDLLADHPIDRLFWYEQSFLTHFTLITTWQCNLRCSHCNVGEHLRWTPEKIYDPQKLQTFLDRFQRIYPYKELEFHLIGGELLLQEARLKALTSIVRDRARWMSFTSNLTVLPANLDVIKQYDQILVSLDGLPAEHDKQRGLEGPFKKTYRNLAILVKAGLRDKVFVSCCLPNPDDIHYEDSDFSQFILLLKSIGIHEDNIHMGYSNPSARDQVHSEFSKKLMKNPSLSSQPCCGQRYMHNLCITPDSQIWTNYYGVNKEDHKLGSLDSSIEDIRQNYADSILHKSHFAKDPNCMKCEALAYCWGHHCYAKWKYNTDLPSSFCDQEGVIRSMKNRITDYGDNYPLIKGVTFRPEEDCNLGLNTIQVCSKESINEIPSS